MALATEMGKLKLNKHEIHKGFALAIVNEKFTHLVEYRHGADADRKNIEEFCKIASFTVNDISGLKEFSENNNSEQQPIDTRDLKFTDNGDLKTHDLTAEEMSDLFKSISKGDFSSYDAFICFISSHGDSRSGGILGVDGEFITVKEILRPFKKCLTLAGKPKLFFTQSCRGYRKDTGIRPGKVVADHGNQDITVPIEADILVAYSSVDGYESYRDEEEGSWFITVLTKALREHGHNTNLMDMLVIVNEMVAKFDTNNWKQMPCFTSTLRMAINFKISGSSGSSSQQPPVLNESQQLPAATQKPQEL